MQKHELENGIANLPQEEIDRVINWCDKQIEADNVFTDQARQMLNVIFWLSGDYECPVDPEDI